MTTGQYISKANVPPGSTVEHRDDGRTFVWYPKGERVTVKLGGPAPWEVLTADMAREAYWTIRGEWGSGPGELLDYADAVDALTRSEEAS